MSADEEQVVSCVMDCAFTVHRVLGPGFREKAYQRAFCLELDCRGLRFEAEKPIEVLFKLGEFQDRGWTCWGRIRSRRRKSFPGCAHFSAPRCSRT